MPVPPAPLGQHAGNLFRDASAPPDGERFETLLTHGPLRIERIVSSDRPDHTLYDQPQDEWVCLLRGSATLWVEGKTVLLDAGDFVFLPAHTPHRVESTSEDPACLWLAVHLYPEQQTWGET